MHVRDATREDRPKVRDVHAAAVRGVDPGAYTARQVDAWDHDRDPSEYPVEDPDHRVVVAERDGEVVGFGDANLEAGELRAVYVHPDHAGRGVGSALVANLEGRLAERGHRTVELLASRNAVGFYERAGYEPAGRESVEQPGGVEMDCVWMVKDLPERSSWGRMPA